MRVAARALLLAPPEDVWELLSEPYHLTDWWPGYQGVQPDRRGFASGAQWHVVRGPAGVATSGLHRRPGRTGTLVIGDDVEGSLIAWHDVEQRVEVRASLRPVSECRTEVEVVLEAPGWRVAVEGLRPVPRRAARRLYDLCQTAAAL
jgi:Polyketide cyclase / dehydrase and lipid transport